MGYCLSSAQATKVGSSDHPSVLHETHGSILKLDGDFCVARNLRHALSFNYIIHSYTIIHTVLYIKTLWRQCLCLFFFDFLFSMTSSQNPPCHATTMPTSSHH
eukprot:TRINITY_DN10170_c1_g2_i1.p1 TRINITY_DN10170_c1_g2~~TRINITY_DN10170_c1_g2_i1.p1  ORF type:complete len:103 (+),score=4.29 TRINITY_DN10170_c1_g2_i1:300-608(+)